MATLQAGAGIVPCRANSWSHSRRPCAWTPHFTTLKSAMIKPYVIDMGRREVSIVMAEGRGSMRIRKKGWKRSIAAAAYASVSKPHAV